MRKLVHTTFADTRPCDSLGRDGWATIDHVETVGTQSRYVYAPAPDGVTHSQWHNSAATITVYREDKPAPQPQPQPLFVVLADDGITTEIVRANSLVQALAKSDIVDYRVLSVTRLP
jgi:hypothetical protein